MSQNIKDEGLQPASVVITKPLDNAEVNLGSMVVEGDITAPDTIVVVRLYSAADEIEVKAGVKVGTRWSAVFSKPEAVGNYRLELGSQNVKVRAILMSPIIDEPTNNQTIGVPFVVSGSRGIPSGESIYVYGLPGEVLLKDGVPVAADGSWTTTITTALPATIVSLTAKQKYKGVFSPLATAVTIVRLAAPTFEKPSEGENVDKKRPEISGLGRPGSTVDVWQTNPFKQLVTGASVGTNGKWSKVSEVDLDLGQRTIRAKATFNGGKSPETNDWTFTVLPAKPQITGPDSAVSQNQTFNVTGINGIRGCEIHILDDLGDNTPLGKVLLQTDGTWTVLATVPVRLIRLVAEQVLGSVRSGRSPRRDFSIRPPRVVLQEVKADDHGTVTIKGTGHVGAELEIFYVNTPNYEHTFKVTETPWIKIYPDWLPGSYLIRAWQWVSGIANAKIYSEWSEGIIDFVVKVPPPTLTHQVDTDQKPVFSGTGKNWVGLGETKVELQVTSGSNPTVPSLPNALVASNLWSNTAVGPWDPGTFSVKARQLFTPTGKPPLQSDWTEPRQVVIKAPLPSIDPIAENGLFPNISGTCWKGAVVTLIFSDANTTPHSVSDSDKDGEWTFTRPTAFKPGSHTVKAIQTFGEQASNEVTQPFTVAISTPVITPMKPPVGYEPSIAGSGGLAGAEMTIYDYWNDRSLGNATVTADGWSVQLQELEFRLYEIYAVQSFNGLPSEKSPRISFEVVLLPPIIETPNTGDKVARTFRIEGRASRASGSDVSRVQVWLQGGTEPWDCVRVKYDGTWWYNATLPLGAETLTFKQLFKGQESEPSLDLVIGVVPAKPVIETPTSGEAIESRVAISGFGYGGDTVSVAFADALDVILGTAQVLENGTWSLWLLLDRPASHPSLVVQQSFGDYLSGWTAPRPVELRTQPPQFTAPLPGRWVKSQPTFAGTARPGAAIRLQAWFNPDINLMTFPAVGEDWEATPPNELSQSEHWVCAVQSVEQGGKQVSATTDSARFEIMPAKDGDADLNL